MDLVVNQEWTSSEVEGARSLIVKLNNSKIIYDDNDEINKKHNDIVDALHALFPSKTVQQVTNLYIDLVVEMHMMQWKGENYVTSGSPYDVCTAHEFVSLNHGATEEEGGASAAHKVYTVGHLVNDNFEGHVEATTMDDDGLMFGCELEGMRIMETGKMIPMVEKQKIDLVENNLSHDQPVVAPQQRRYWTTEEHRLFLRGLRVYGRGDWKNISKYFVTTKTPIQVSSHAQKYFKRLEKGASSKRQRYSINDVGLHDDPWALDNNSGPRQVLAFTGLNHDQTLGLQAPTSSFLTNNLAQLQAPFIYNQQMCQQTMWSEEQMMGSGAAIMEGIGNFGPAYQQGSTYFPPSNV